MLALIFNSAKVVIEVKQTSLTDTESDVQSVGFMYRGRTETNQNLFIANVVKIRR